MHNIGVYIYIYIDMFLPVASSILGIVDGIWSTSASSELLELTSGLALGGCSRGLPELALAWFSALKT